MEQNNLWIILWDKVQFNYTGKFWFSAEPGDINFVNQKSQVSYN